MFNKLCLTERPTTGCIKYEEQNCEYAKLATYKVRNKNAKVNIWATKTDIVYSVNENVKPVSN